MEFRKDPLTNNYSYHILSRSIAKFIVFNNDDDYLRFIEMISLYRYSQFQYRYSKFKELTLGTQKTLFANLENTLESVSIIAFCLMPTHIHLLLKQNTDEGISKFMAKVLNSYTRYFNTRHHRKGPLWEGHFKNVLVRGDEQLLHLSRYIHLNPSSASLVENPEDWAYSSLNEYLCKKECGICSFQSTLDIQPIKYKKFVGDRKSYQQQLSLIKKVLIDNYSG